MKKYFTLFRIGIAEALSTRGTMLYWVIVDLISVGVMPFLWIAVVHARGEPIHGFGATQLITYFLGSALIWQVVVSYPFSVIIPAIQRGDLAHDLVRPLSYFAKILFLQLGHRIPRFFMTLPFLVTVIFLFGRFILLPKNVAQFAMLFASILVAYFLIYLIHCLVGMVTFWFEEAWGVVDAFLLVFMFLSGDFAPLAFLPSWLFSVASFLPFQYVINFPLQIYLGHIDATLFWSGIARALLWIGVLLCTYRVMWKRGVMLFTGVGR